MRPTPKLKAVTLIELVIAVILLSVISLAVSNIDTFSRFQVISSEHRAVIQNELQYTLERMAKQVSRSIGNEKIDGARNVTNASVTDLLAFIDANNDGARDASDYWVAFRFPQPAGSNNLNFCGQCSGPTCGSCLVDWEVLSNHVQGANFIESRNATDGTLLNNAVSVNITACWDPDGAPFACGTPNNPSVNMNTTIKMPSVSTN